MFIISAIKKLLNIGSTNKEVDQRSDLTKLIEHATQYGLEDFSIRQIPEKKGLFHFTFKYNGRPCMLVTSYAGLYSESQGNGEIRVQPISSPLDVFTYDYISYEHALKAIPMLGKL